jgi:hypothetical protein
VNDVPFYFNDIQFQVDKLYDAYGWSNDEVQLIFQIAADGGFTVVNTQIR